MNSICSCGVCSKLTNELNKHTHHRVPRALGGSNDPSNLIDICSECHGILHNVALKMLNRKANGTVIVDSVKMIYKENVKAIKVCLELAVQVRNEMILAKESTQDPNTIVEISTTLRRKHKDIVRFHCRDHGVSMEDYLRGLICKDLLRKHGVNPVDERQIVKSLSKKHSV